MYQKSNVVFRLNVPITQVVMWLAENIPMAGSGDHLMRPSFQLSADAMWLPELAGGLLSQDSNFRIN